MQINLQLFLNVFLWIFMVILSLGCSNKPTIKIIDGSFLCKWANIHNQYGFKKFFIDCKCFIKSFGDRMKIILF